MGRILCLGDQDLPKPIMGQWQENEEEMKLPTLMLSTEACFGEEHRPHGGGFCLG